MHRGTDQSLARGFMLRAPLFQRSMERREQCYVTLVGAVQRPAYFGQRQRPRVDEVAALPLRLKLLFEIEERTILAWIAKLLCQEIDTVSQKGVVGAINITQRR